MAAMPDLNRRHAMSMAGIAALAAAMPIPAAGASPSRQDLPLDRVPPPAAPPGGTTSSRTSSTARPAPPPIRRSGRSRRPARRWRTRRSGSCPRTSASTATIAATSIVDGKSNLVFHAAKDGNTYYSGKLFGKWRGGIGHTWEARIKLNCLTPGCLARVVPGQQQPGQRRRSRRHGVVRQRPLGRGNRRPRQAERRRARQPGHHRRQRVAHVARPVG